MNRGSLLLVDDDRHVLDSMADWLREQQYSVDEATGYAEAIRAVNQNRYDLVLADIHLNDGDGFDILAHCRDNYPNVIVILITGYGTVETGIEALREGAFDFDLIPEMVCSDPAYASHYAPRFELGCARARRLRLTANVVWTPVGPPVR